MKEQNSKYNLVLCEIHYTPIHGKDIHSNNCIEGHYLVVATFEPKTSHLVEDYIEYDTDRDCDSELDVLENEMPNIQNVTKLYKSNYNKLLQSNLFHDYPHSTIRNYRNIVAKPNYFKPEIAQCIVLPTNETIAILKTFWIKIIQRKWKKIYQQIKKQRK